MRRFNVVVSDEAGKAADYYKATTGRKSLDDALDAILKKLGKEMGMGGMEGM